jgi:hypothetical protein
MNQPEGQKQQRKNGPSLHEGMRLAWFTAKTLFSKNKHNLHLMVLNALLNPSIVRSNRDAITITDTQWILELNSSAGTPAPSTGGSVGTYLLMSVQSDYLTCRTYDGTIIGPTDIYIAKPPYSYAFGPDGPGGSNVQRTNSANGVSEVEFVTPVWQAYNVVGPGGPPDVIFAINANPLVNGPNGPITLLRTGESRQWAAL